MVLFLNFKMPIVRWNWEIALLDEENREGEWGGEAERERGRIGSQDSGGTGKSKVYGSSG